MSTRARSSRSFLVGSLSVGLAAALAPEGAADARGCPGGMVSVDGDFCIDRYEASLVEVVPGGGERPFSPFAIATGRKVRAVSRRGVVPQAYVSRNDAELACRAAKKRLCTSQEWLRACRGRRPTKFPYGDTRKAGHCNDAARVSPVVALYGGADEVFRYEPLNDPRLNQLPGTVAKTGAYPRCTNGYGVYDMVGNLHEWVADAEGTFRGGYFLDTHENGDGCDYVTVAHGPEYHDYSTGFRCCADERGGRR